MVRNELVLDLNEELIVDGFAGGGGASMGIEMALGRHVDIAINHDPLAVALHTANHPQTKHYCESIFKVDPLEVTNGRRIGLAWFSPDCRHFSKAKGGKPRPKKIRGLAWIVLKWAKLKKPRVILLENVEEFQDWGPLNPDGMPCERRKGRTFKYWVGKLRRYGYQVEYKLLRACDYGAPTIRNRLYLIARCDGKPIVWPQPTHGDPNKEGFSESRLKPWRTAAECIDWSLPCPSIFLTKRQAKIIGVKRPLAPATERRIARGIKKFVLDAKEPFIVRPAHGDGWGERVHSTRKPLLTQTGSNEFGLAFPFVTPLTHQGSDRVDDIQNPFKTITAAHRGETALTMPFVAGVGGRMGQSPERSAGKPMQTITAKADSAIVTPFLAGMGGPTYGGKPRPADAPMGTLTTENHQGVVMPFTVGAGGPARQGEARTPDKPFQTMLAKNDQYLASAVISDANRPQEARNRSPNEPIRTQMAEVKGGHFQLVQAFLAKHYGGVVSTKLPQPIGTVTAKDHHSLVASHLSKIYGTTTGQETDTPMHTITGQGNHIAEVRAFLQKYYSQGGQDQDVMDPMHTIPTKQRLGLVTVEGVDYQISDIGMRMLVARELYRGQGFPETYIIDIHIEVVDKKGKLKRKPISNEAKVRMCGNSVCPDVAEALVACNVPDMAAWRNGERHAWQRKVKAWRRNSLQSCQAA